MQEQTRKIAQWMLSTFEEHLQDKTSGNLLMALN